LSMLVASTRIGPEDNLEDNRNAPWRLRSLAQGGAAAGGGRSSMAGVQDSA
jgi:hypothetical protein